MYLYFNQRKYQKVNILSLIIIVLFCIIIVSFNFQSSSAVTSIEGGGQNNSQYNPEILQ